MPRGIVFSIIGRQRRITANVLHDYLVHSRELPGVFRADPSMLRFVPRVNPIVVVDPDLRSFDEVSEHCRFVRSMNCESWIFSAISLDGPYASPPDLANSEFVSGTLNMNNRLGFDQIDKIIDRVLPERPEADYP